MAKLNPSVEELVGQAEEILKTQDVFILAYDIIDSKKLGDRRQAVHSQQQHLHGWVNNDFSGELASFQWNRWSDNFKTGMHFFAGDSGVVGLSRAQDVRRIVEKARSIFDVGLRWAVGESAWDEKIKRIA